MFERMQSNKYRHIAASIVKNILTMAALLRPEWLAVFVDVHKVARWLKTNKNLTNYPKLFNGYYL